ncbi:MAG: hypothetical protein NTZ89_05340, partial [Actinobacteria bacterium]|nr:hypothetical protein [Actinomycetota bacterium]
NAQNPVAPKKYIYVFKISEEIAKPVWYKTKKALNEAAALKASDISFIVKGRNAFLTSGLFMVIFEIPSNLWYLISL